MSLITFRIKENAKKCEECAVLKMRNRIDHNSVLSEESELLASGILKLTCAACKYGEDFKKVYGVMPYEKYQGIS